ncbi:MAG: hypothetical protein JWL69_287 [Phycisphaerales bacterium]|jgi:pimeloyl-ACP methyl ester carboxylesterase|nr:hypothetical protein [Phycisphaerales bacterium]MDB5357638.1 hypothetical protein [Phycisphaerales bacterium]
MPGGRRKLIRTWLKRIVVGFLVLYVLGILVTFFWPDWFLLHPSTRAIVVPQGRRVEVAGPAGSLEIWTSRTMPSAAEPEAFVLAFNGNGSRAERELARLKPMWAGHDVEIWAVNYPGYGGSNGSALVRNIPPAALAAYDALAQKAHGRPIFVSGHSIGTTAALYVGANRPVVGLVLHNPPPLRQLIHGRFGWFNLWIASSCVVAAVPDQLDSLANGGTCSAPAVFILADRDRLVLPEYQQKVVDAYRGPKRSVHAAKYGHNTPVVDPEVARVRPVIDWLWGQVFALPPPSEP